MSDLTPEVLDELERRVMNSLPEPWAALPWGDGSSPNGHVNIVWQDEQGDGVVIMKDVLVDDAKATVDLRNHARDLIEAVRERDRLDRLLKTEIADNCEYDTEIRAMCNHVDDQYREPLPDVVRKVVEERDRLRTALSEARQFIATGVEFGYITVLCDEIDRLRKEVMRLKAIASPESAG